MHSTKSSLSAERMALSSNGPVNVRPSGSAPEASTSNLPALSRHLPTASKFSSPKPSGSMRTWHEAHVGWARCASSDSRSDLETPTTSSARLGTSPGGGGGAELRMFSRMYFPRKTGEVRFAYEE